MTSWQVVWVSGVGNVELGWGYGEYSQCLLRWNGGGIEVGSYAVGVIAHL